MQSPLYASFPVPAADRDFREAARLAGRSAFARGSCRLRQFGRGTRPGSLHRVRRDSHSATRALYLLEMIFVSYSHADEAWRKRFETVSKPLSRAESMVFWSDKNIKMGEWETQIETAMKDAVAAVLLVSDNFLASDYIVEKELPYLINATKKSDFKIIWAYLEPCDLQRFPQVKTLQAMTLGELKPMAAMNQWEWKQTMLKGCDMIDDFLKNLERQSINSAVVGKSFPKKADLDLLSRPARRRVEVLVYAAPKWWRQSPIEPGITTTTIHLGNDSTKKGTRFNVIAMTTDKPLAQQTYLSLPECRTKSEEITLVRA
jgi:hypothetical protein